jgi:hypothetical protein
MYLEYNIIVKYFNNVGLFNYEKIHWNVDIEFVVLCSFLFTNTCQERKLIEINSEKVLEKGLLSHYCRD